MEQRRSFLKKSGLVVLGLAASTVISPIGPALAKTKKYAMIVDLDRCTGCQSCVIACKAQNKTTKGFFNTRIETREEGKFPKSFLRFIPRQCNQCEEPPCVDACGNDATFKLTNGIVVTDWERCVGDGACVASCPYDARFLDPESGNKADKCDFCVSRLEKGLEPECVVSCPSAARIFGDLANPEGEFASYIKNKKLQQPLENVDTGAKVLYRDSRKG